MTTAPTDSKITETADAVGIKSSVLFGDCWDVMQEMDSETIDLIYIDPPYYSQADYKGDSGAFSDKWESLHQYLNWIVVRLYEMKRLLKPTGSIYIHCDWHASHYLKVEMDKIMGGDCFLNDVAWLYGLGGSSSRYWPRKHDSLLWYAKQAGKQYFIPDMIPATSIRMAGKMKKAPDFWDIPAVNNMAKERNGYPTQKPEALLQRVIRSSCPEGGTIADFFCGSGTTAAVAQRMGRNWIICDKSQDAISLATKRIFSQSNASGKGAAMKRQRNGRTSPLLCSPPVALPLRLRERGGDAWVEDANGVEVIAQTHGFKSDKAHEDWCRWVVRAANAANHARSNSKSPEFVLLGFSARRKG